MYMTKYLLREKCQAPIPADTPANRYPLRIPEFSRKKLENRNRLLPTQKIRSSAAVIPVECGITRRRILRQSYTIRRKEPYHTDFMNSTSSFPI